MICRGKVKVLNLFKLYKVKVSNRLYVDIQKLYNLRQKYHKLIDDIFNTHERNLRNQIRSQYKISENDTSKLKAAI